MLSPFSNGHGMSGNDSQTPSKPTPILGNSAEYLGPTSFTSVFMEHSEHFEVNHALRSSNPIRKSGHKDEKAPSSSPIEFTLDPHLLQLGVQVLRYIPDEGSCNVLFSKHVNPNDGWIRMAGRALSDSMWHTYGRVLVQKPRSGLLDVARTISRNSTQLLAPENPRSWIQSFSGKNVR